MADPKDFEDTPTDWARFWSVEFKAAQEWLKGWWEDGDRTVQEFLSEHESAGNELYAKTRVNFFTANVQTTEAVLYGKTPQVSVTRRFGDGNDKGARVAGEMMERVLNTDIERDGDNCVTAIEQSVGDWLRPGFGLVRLRYVVDTETEDIPEQTDPNTGAVAPAYQKETRKENIETEYVYWKDVLWNKSRNFHDVRWFAFRVPMSREQLASRYGEDIAADVPMSEGTLRETGNDERDGDKTPWDNAEVWEIWSKQHKKFFVYIEGYSRVLESKDDPLGLDGFWPFPKPLMANLTSSAFRPTPDFKLAKDIYDEINTISTRITLLERSIKAAGVYDKTLGDLSRLLKEDHGNELIPSENWGVFSERGGMSKGIDWLPIEQVVKALTVLREYRVELKSLLDEITGMSDIVRGMGNPGETATAQSIKGRFASVRLQKRQNEIARFASELQRIKGEIISKWFAPETIVERSNIMYTADAPLAQQGVQTIKDKLHQYKIEVRAETMAMEDYAKLHQEGSDVIGSLGTFFQALGPAVQMLGPGGPAFLLQLAQWYVSRIKGSASMEALFDQTIAQLQQAQQQAQMRPPQPPPPDPRLMAVQVKAKTELMKPQAELQADLQRIHAETQADVTKQAAQAHFANATAEAAQRREALNAVNGLLDGK